MAAAEARAAWQRSANRSYFSDEVKAHLFSGCSSSSPDDPDPATPACILHGAKSDPTPKTKWWLDLQPKNQQKYFTCEQRNTLEVDSEVLRMGLVSKDFSHSISDNNSITGKPENISTASMNNRDNSRMHELQVVPGSDPFITPKSKEMGELNYLDSRMMELDFSNSSNFEQSKKLACDFESDWLRIEKNEPWWHTADNEELASLVSQKSLENIENCDLPPPQTKLLRSGQSLNWDYFGCDLGLSSSIDKKTEFSSPMTSSYARGSTISVSERTKGPNQSHSSNSHIPGGSYSYNENGDEPNISEDELSRDQLVEALCHSQTRAREAEKAAEQAYGDKERIITIFFRQAAELFAYKQWLQLLQLENFCLQLKNKNHLPVGLSSMSYESNSTGKRRHRVGKKKRHTSKHGLNKCALAFAVGLGLVSAGLLFGWGMGLLFPSF